MKKAIGSALVIAAFLASSSAGLAQSFNVEGKKPPSVTTVRNQVFTSTEGRFAIGLPLVVGSYQPVSVNTPSGKGTGEAYTWRMYEGRFTVIYLDIPETITDASAANVALDRIRDQASAQVSNVKGKLINENKISLANYSGRELKFDLPDSVFTIRMYLVGNRLYQLSLAVPTSQQSTESVAIKVLDSFKFLTPGDVEAALKKKIAESTPSPLPQLLALKRPKSDAADEGLIGRVKVVATEDEDLSGTWAVSKRKPSLTSYFDEVGNHTKKELYDYRGNLMEISVYGYIDGERVSNSKSITYEYNPPPMMAPPSATNSQLKRDPRYSTRYKFRYDDKGNLAEKELYGNDGTLWMRYVYNRAGGQKEELVYASDGSLNQKYLSILDDKGNVLESTDFDVKKNSIRNKYSYTYELDSRGNWTKRVTAKWVIRDGKSSFEPAWVTYRTITYY